LLTVRIAVGADHAGFLLKEHLKQTLAQLGHLVDDHGTRSEAAVDYPPICFAVGRAVAEGRADRGLVVGGTGQGEQIAANKVHGARAALCSNEFMARLAREHNDANVLSLGGRVLGNELALAVVDVFLGTTFAGGRHARRVGQITDIEREECSGSTRPQERED
jgi:ribose 5-phosphate isomerase B